MLVVKRFEFDAAHRLYPYEGKCANIHGHRYAVEVGIYASELDCQDMVFDFGKIKTVIGAWIDSHVDHALILSRKDPFFTQLSTQTMTVAVPGSPTAEILARTMLDVFSVLVGDCFRSGTVQFVRVFETPTCYAEARAE